MLLILSCAHFLTKAFFSTSENFSGCTEQKGKKNTKLVEFVFSNNNRIQQPF